MANFQEGSSRINFLSSYDFTSSGTTYLAPYIVVKLDSNNQVTPVTATTDAAVGVIYNCPTATGTADVLSLNQAGTGKITAGGTITKGALITFNSSGKAVAATQTTAGSQPTVLVIGRAIEAGASGQVFCFQNFFFLY
jgi:hypothetical protein